MYPHEVSDSHGLEIGSMDDQPYIHTYVRSARPTLRDFHCVGLQTAVALGFPDSVASS